MFGSRGAAHCRPSTRRSLDLDAKPEWFGDLPWPPVDPTDPASVDTPIPAQQRFAP